MSAAIRIGQFAANLTLFVLIVPAALASFVWTCCWVGWKAGEDAAEHLAEIAARD